MKVKIRETIYNAENEPIMLILTEEDKRNIALMDGEAKKYLAFPKGSMTKEEAEDWMSD